jgi:hypothetical protein
MARKGKYFYHSVGAKMTGITKVPVLIAKLCRKKYLKVRKSQLEKNLALPISEINQADFRSSFQLIASLPPSYKNVPISYFYHLKAVKWIAEPYPKNTLFPEELIYKTDNAVLVRSKSEKEIANYLEKLGLPYRYDSQMRLGGKTICPDFVIMNPFNGKKIIWEHFGALHKPGYDKKMSDKMKLLMELGFLPNENLFFSFEFDLIGNPRFKTVIDCLAA